MSFKRETGEIERLTTDYVGVLGAIVSPDGKWLVYVCDMMLRCVCVFVIW